VRPQTGEIPGSIGRLDPQALKERPGGMTGRINPKALRILREWLLESEFKERRND